MRIGYKLTSIVVLVMVSAAALAGPTLPDDVLGVLEVRGLDSAISDVSLLAKPLGIPLETEALTAMLSSKLSSSGLAGIDRKRPAIIVLLSAKAPAGNGPAMPGQPEGTIVLPLTDDGKTYLKILEAAYDTVEKNEALSRFQNPVGQGALFHDIHVAIVKKHMVMSDKPESVKRVMAHLQKGTLKVDMKIPVSGTIRAAVNVKPIVAVAEAFAGMMSPGGPGGGNPNAPDPMAPVKTMLNAIKQMETVSAGLKGGKEDLTLVVRIDPVADSFLSKTFLRLEPPASLYASLIPTGSPLVYAGSGLEIWDDLLEPYLGWMDNLYKQIGAMTGDTSMETMWQNLRATVAETKGMYSGDFASGFLTEPDGTSLGFVQVTAVNDPAAVLKIIEKSLLATKDLPDMPFKVVVRKARTYKGVKVNRYKYVVDLGDEAKAGIPPEVAALLDKLDFEVAMVNKAAATAYGSPRAMNLIIDRIKRGSSSTASVSAELRKLFPMLGTKPVVGFWTMDVLATVKAVMTLVPNADLSLVQQIPAGEGKLGGYATQKDGALVMVTKIAVSEILAIKAAIGPIQQVATKLAAGMTSETEVKPTDPKAMCVKNLRLIRAAKQVYALEVGVDGAAVPEVDKLLQYFPGRKMPACPAGGKYTINAVEANPTCSSADHGMK